MIQGSPSQMVRLALLAAFSATLASTGLAQTEKSQPTVAQRQKMSEMHQKMAAMHSKMAACLTSEKTPVQCRQEMADSCSSDFGSNCPMTGDGMMGGKGQTGGKGMGMMNNGNCMDWMMNPNSAAPVATQPKK